MTDHASSSIPVDDDSCSTLYLIHETVQMVLSRFEKLDALAEKDIALWNEEDKALASACVSATLGLVIVFARPSELFR